MITKAAIYARKSQEQNDVAAEQKSVAQQEASARAFIAKQGWSLDEEHIYIDDGVSGALFLERPDFQRMLRDARNGEFDAIVCFDLDRFGRHGRKSMEALNILADVGVTVFDSSNGQQVDLDSFEGETMAYLRTRMAEEFREKIRKHTKRAMRKKAESGLATGNRIFGYDNVRIKKGETILQENKAEADIVRQIYTRCAAGEGARTIARALNMAGVPKPRAQQGRRDGWSVSTVRAVLSRPLYRGEIVYGRTAKALHRELKKVHRNTTREKGQIPQPEENWTRTHVARLRIVDADLAARVDARLKDRRERYLSAVAKNNGTAPHKAHGKYLLSGGMLVCPTCGGHFEARKHPWRPYAGGHPGNVYICSTRRRKPGVCPNTLALPIEDTDNTVLDIIEGEVLGTAYIKELMVLVGEAPDETAWLTSERDRMQTEVDRLVESIAAGVPGEVVAPLISEKQSTIRRLQVRLDKPRLPRLGHDRLRSALEQRAKKWKADLRAEPRVARLVLRRLVGPLTLWDESERPEFVKWEAARTTGLLDGIATLHVASPSGFEPEFWP